MGDGCLVQWDWGQRIADKVFTEYGLAMFVMFCVTVFCAIRWVMVQKKFDHHRDENQKLIVSMSNENMADFVGLTRESIANTKDTGNALNTISTILPSVVASIQAMKESSKDEIRSLRFDLLGRKSNRGQKDSGDETQRP